MTLRSTLLRIVNSLTLPGYKFKTPGGFDFSHWETIPNWKDVVLPPGTSWLSTKATEASNWVDPTFVPNFDAFGRYWPNTLRSAYHFFVATDPAGQVKNFVRMARMGGFNPERDQAVLDEEYTGTVRGGALASMVEYVLKGIEDGLGVRPIIYWSRYNASFLGTPPAWMNDYWHWVAWYPYSAYIDRNAWVPDSLIPSGLDPKKVMGWQYATNWVLQGIPYDGVDVNMVSQVYLDSLHPTIPPQPFKPYIKFMDVTRVVDEAGTTKVERIA